MQLGQFQTKSMSQLSRAVNLSLRGCFAPKESQKTDTFKPKSEAATSELLDLPTDPGFILYFCIFCNLRSAVNPWAGNIFYIFSLILPTIWLLWYKYIWHHLHISYLLQITTLHYSKFKWVSWYQIINFSSLWFIFHKVVLKSVISNKMSEFLVHFLTLTSPVSGRATALARIM